MKKTICLALLAVLFLFANSCHDEVGVDSELTLKSGKLKKDVVTEMKLWFDSNPDVNKFVLLEYADEVKWASAQVMEIDNSIVTEVQVKLKEKHIVMSEKDPTLNFEHRLLFIHKAGEITSYMEYFISKKDIGYLHDTEKTSYLKMDGSFEGSIVLENNKGESSVIYHSTGNSQELRLKNVDPVCYELIQIFTDGSYRVVAQLGCSGGNSTPTGTAGSSHPSTNPTPPLLSQLKSLFKQGTTLEPQDVDKLNEAFSTMNLDCMLNAVTTFLTNNQIALGSVSINTNLLGNASIDAQGNLTFAGSWAITSEYLSHEWFHLGQKKMNSVNNSTDGYAEFEDWLFFDIKETIRVQGNFGTSNHHFACYKANFDVYRVEYQNWLMSITNNGTTFPTANTMGFYNFGPKFAETRGYSFLSFSNTSYNPITMFNLFNNCK